MTDETNQSTGLSSQSPVSGHHKKGLKIFLISSAGILVVALAVTAVLLLGGSAVSEDRIERVMEYGTVLQGVSVDGVDLSGMTADEAYAATANVESEALAKSAITIDLAGETLHYDATAFGFETDYNDMMKQALAYGHNGSFEEREEAADTARNTGVKFEIKVSADKAKVSAGLAALETTFNAEAKDATATFMPNGYFADGTPYDPATYDEATQGAPQLVTLADADKPNSFRYQYWKTKAYVDNYIPKDAYIARFLYTPEQKGLKTDMDKLADMIVSAVQNSDYSTITASTEATEPAVTLEQVKAQTQLVSSWTSSYIGHSSANRVHNVSKLSGIINGVTLKPNVVWSINEEAGPRTTANGWKEAAGISGGAFVPDPGGGVCQISSTLYNASLRSGITVVSFKHHSIISEYMPIGLDATISTGSPDLKLKNTNATPMYIVSYMNRSEKNVTVEIYGTPVVDKEYGDVILNFTSKKVSTGSVPDTSYYYNQTKTPDGDSISAGKSVTYVVARASTTATIYIHYLKLDGTEITSKQYDTARYPSIRGKVYCNYNDPSKPVVAPSPPASSKPSPSTSTETTPVP